jgi:hypothetical protein
MPRRREPDYWDWEMEHMRLNTKLSRGGFHKKHPQCPFCCSPLSEDGECQNCGERFKTWMPEEENKIADL